MFEKITDLLPVKARPYAKLIAGIVGIVLTVLSVVATDNHIVTVAISVATALGIYGVPNKDSDGDGTPDFMDPDEFEIEEPEPAEVPGESGEDIETAA